MTPKRRRLERMWAIEREWQTASMAAEVLGDRLRADPAAMADRRLGGPDFRNFRDNLEATYLIRIFAEFETGLREAWSLAFGQTTSPRTRDLVDSLTARCTIARSWCSEVHEIRNYRNSLIHEGLGDIRPVGLVEACGRLCRFFSRLPHEW